MTDIETLAQEIAEEWYGEAAEAGSIGARLAEHIAGHLTAWAKERARLIEAGYAPEDIVDCAIERAEASRTPALEAERTARRKANERSTKAIRNMTEGADDE